MPKTKGAMTVQPTLVEMRSEIKTLRKKIKVAEREAFLKPFIVMVYEARKKGKLLEMEVACRKMIDGKNPDDILEGNAVDPSAQKASSDSKLSCFQRALNMYAPIM